MHRSCDGPRFAGEEGELQRSYRRLIDAQSAPWQGTESSLPALAAVYDDTTRRRREQAWRLATERRLADREAISQLWQALMLARRQVYADDGPLATRFHHAVEEWVTPVLVRRHEERRQTLGLRRLRPWDLAVDPHGRPPLRPFSSEGDLGRKAIAVMRRLHPDLGSRAELAVGEGVLGRMLPASQTCCRWTADLPAARSFAITGTQQDVEDAFHRLGHAIASHGKSPLPAEIAALATELFAAEHLGAVDAFYDDVDAGRARAEQRERWLLRWVSAAMIDAFECWAYTAPNAVDLASCGVRWRSLWLRFLPGVDWAGLDEALGWEWQSRAALFLAPCHGRTWASAQLVAVQIWGDARREPDAGVERYRQMLSSGPGDDMLSIPFDEHRLREAVDLIREGMES